MRNAFGYESLLKYFRSLGYSVAAFKIVLVFLFV